MGNPTYFALPLSYSDHHHIEDNLFYSFPNFHAIDNESLIMVIKGESNISTSSSKDIVQVILDKIKL